VLASTLAAAALSLLSAVEPVRLASPGLRQADVGPEVVAADMTRLNEGLGLKGVHVLTHDEANATLSADTQAQLLACVLEVSNCSAALSNSLGLDGVLTGSIRKGESGFQLELEVLSARDGSTISAYASHVDAEAGLLDEMSAAAKKLGAELVRKLAPGFVADAPLDVAKAVPDAGVSLMPGAPPAQIAAAGKTPGAIIAARITVVTGAAVAGIGAVFLVLAKTQYDDVDTAKVTDSNCNQSLAAARSVANSGATYQNAGIVVASVGAATLLTGMVLYFANGGKNEQSTLPPGISPHTLHQGMNWDFP
jgi:hypothetical protein